MRKWCIPPDVYDALLQLNQKVKDTIAEKLNASEDNQREGLPDQPLSLNSIDMQS